ncbi:MAG: excinuclease ABC subunit C [Muribaculaceae bacterium]|nr:excinuclease ABC subunit C [Muribaculaceae bacterium]
MDSREELMLKVGLLPDSPGVYMYFDGEGKIIYVGKAKRLKRRVSSYFNRVHSVARTNILVKNIRDLKYIVVDSEEDALHLENSLIKEHKPRYNVLLKDDKSYPWICVTNELYPRVFLTRETPKRGGKFYGPYSNVNVARTVIELIRELYPIRTCRHVFTKEMVERRKIGLCLQYHIKNCLGCCTGEISPEEYHKFIDEIRQILNGNTQQLCDYLIDEMQSLASELKFEEAQLVKQKYELVEKYRAKSVIVSSHITDVDVYAIERDETNAYINYLHLRNGSIVQCLTLEYSVKMQESDEELLSMAIAEIIVKFDRKPREILVPVIPETEMEGVQFVVPKIGDKKKLVDIALKNAKQYMLDKITRSEKLNPQQRTMRVLKTMQRDFRLEELPRHIECFDNSNTQGTNPVASCVVFKDAVPSKRDYRHFNIKTVEGPDDFASMKEVLTRRYTRLVQEGEELPQLVIVDGGKGQLSAAVEAFDAMGLRGKIALVGIAKRLEEIYFPGDSVPLYIDKNSESLRVVQRLRDEAHRFGITHHRNRRSKGQTVSILDGIKGVGSVTRDTLLKHFKSVKRLREATEEEIASVVGVAKAKIVVEGLKKED